jgi:hypothetical protein
MMRGPLEGVRVQPLQGPPERGLREHRPRHPEPGQGLFTGLSKVAEDRMNR